MLIRTEIGILFDLKNILVIVGVLYRLNSEKMP